MRILNLKVSCKNGGKIYYLKASRPGLWFQTIWLYLLPTGQNYAILSETSFWIGLIYVCFPLNLLVYGLNDRVDYNLDQGNPRKDSYFFGARGSRDQLQRLPVAIIITQLPFWIYFCLVTPQPWMAFILLTAIVLVNMTYNLPQKGLRTRPPWDLMNQLGYLLVIPLSTLINGVTEVSWWTYLYLGLFCTHANLIGSILDIDPDRAAGRQTSAIAMGSKRSKQVVIGLVLVEAILLITVFSDFALGLFLLLGAGLFYVLVRFYSHRSYSKREYAILGWALNLTGFASIAWVWSQGSLLATRWVWSIF